MRWHFTYEAPNGKLENDVDAETAFLAIAAVAQRLGISARTIQRRIQAGTATLRAIVGPPTKPADVIPINRPKKPKA